MIERQSNDGVVRDQAFWKKLAANQIDWYGKPFVPWWDKDWNIQQTAHTLVRIWWKAEHEFDLLNEYELPAAKQMYYRLSYLNADELQLLRDKYYRPENHPLGDKHLTGKYNKTTDEIRQWRLTILRKLSAYQDKPKGE